MDEDAKRAIAVFRFRVIADLAGGRKLSRGEKERILREKASSRWDIPFSTRSHIGRSTILSWVRAYEKEGRRLESLYPDERKDKGRSRVMDEEAIAALIHLKKEGWAFPCPYSRKRREQRASFPPGTW
jgi:transposase